MGGDCWAGGSGHAHLQEGAQAPGEGEQYHEQLAEMRQVQEGLRDERVDEGLVRVARLAVVSRIGYAPLQLGVTRGDDVHLRPWVTVTCVAHYVQTGSASGYDGFMGGLQQVEQHGRVSNSVQVPGPSPAGICVSCL